MKIIAIFCILVVGVTSASYTAPEVFRDYTRYGSQKFEDLDDLRDAGNRRFVMPDHFQVTEKQRPKYPDLPIDEKRPFQIPQVARKFDRRASLFEEEGQAAEPLPLRLKYLYAHRRLVEGVPQRTRVVKRISPLIKKVRVAKHRPLRVKSSSEHHSVLDIETPRLLLNPEVRPTRVVEAQLLGIKEDIPIKKYHHVINANSAEYSYDFEGANGIRSQESGFLKSIPSSRVISQDDNYGYEDESVEVKEEDDETVHVKSGTTSWCDSEGNYYTLTYTADENGYRPKYTKGVCTIPAPEGALKELVPVPEYKDTRVVQSY